MHIIKRDLFDSVEKQIMHGVYLIIVGPRQVGKTVLLQHLRHTFLPKKCPQTNIFYFNLENEDLLPHFSSYSTLIKYLKLHGFHDKQKHILLLDEFQKMPQPTKLLKLLYDEHPNLQVIATGSSSLDIFQNLRAESMSGRKLILKMLPLSFAEFLRFQDRQLENVFQNLTIDADSDFIKNVLNSDLEPFFQEFVVYGGYPRVVLTKTEEEKKYFLREIYNSYVQKDIQGILKLDNITAYTKLVVLLSSQIGNLVSKAELANTLQLHIKKLETFLTVLEKTFIIKLVNPFFVNKRKEITKMPKIYFLDTGLRNWIIRDFSQMKLEQNTGLLIENFVFNEIYKHLPIDWQIFFWRTRQKTEVDFIIKRDQSLFPVEVKYKPFQRPVIPSGLKAFINHHQARIPIAFVLTKNFSAQVEFNQTEVYFLPAVLAAKIFNQISSC